VLAHFHKIAPGFAVKRADPQAVHLGETGIAGGVYQWRRSRTPKPSIKVPWLDGILARYGVYPEIEYFTTFAIAQNPGAR